LAEQEAPRGSRADAERKNLLAQAEQMSVKPSPEREPDEDEVEIEIEQELEPDERDEGEKSPPIEEPGVADPLALTADELEDIRREARKKVEAELKASNEAARKTIIAKALDAEILEQRRAAGLTDHRDDLVQILIDIAPFDDKIVIDGTMYFHGSWYTVDRRKHDTLREICARSWDAEDRAGNPNRKFYRHVAGSMNPMVHEPMMSDGTYSVRGGTVINARTGAMTGLPSTGRLQ
jgi:hypothetical protein